ncbi:argininosuccinate synthase [Elizabethkingia sp. JS20170427COW]|uniref:argininosuccinate synthase n=1 Tax=Elizabethkingia sp. JS20170427COW TaxID=2583851 RepID=UPI0011103073|nr:argininosuccinate synthase domain-containing protein [Elizabethkingia sp. JS20170427COW]QCX53243.1 argininosuccinate synthase [Elizabethkingia sp. JS20170427COW]
MKKKVVLAYSGGLDTTYCALYLSKTLNYEVHAVTVNTGGFSEEEIREIQRKAETLGIASYTCVDAVVDYYESCVKYLLFGNVLKNNTYPLSVSAERTIQAKSIAEYAVKIGAQAVCHGSTGAGNDQVRFDVVFQILAPEMEIITPIRDLKLSREEEIEFLKSHGVEMNFEKAKYSINKGLWGTSVGGKETLTSHEYLPEEAFPSQVSKTEQETHTLLFDNGELVGVDDEVYNHPTKAIKKLEELAVPFGIGRDIHVGDTIIGIKGRVGFEAASAIIAIKAHHLLEKHTLSKNQLMVKDQLSVMYGNWLHEALYLDPVMRNMEAFFKSSQSSVSGKVFVTFMPYRFILNGIESQFDLMSSKFGQYGEMNKAWTADDVKGFSKILGNSLTIYHQINKSYDK